MELEFAKSDKNRINNRIRRTTTRFFTVPLYTVIKYFFGRNVDSKIILKRANIYFLFLAIFQLLTLGPFPSEWSPTGPYSTTIPLILCILLEIVGAQIKWITNWYRDRRENNKKYIAYDGQRFIQKRNADIYPGDVILLNRNEITPVDGILIDYISHEPYIKISLSLLTGESNINYVNKVEKHKSLASFLKTTLVINNYHPNNLHQLDGYIGSAKVTGYNFIPGGSLIKSDNIIIWVTACGKEKKSYLKINEERDRNKSRIDDFIDSYMINFNAYLLLVLVLVMSSIKLWTTPNASFAPSFIVFCIQNWILFNGIIPFSVKIFLLLVRNVQSILLSSSTIKINNTVQIDDICKVEKIVTDKTGTLTRNELEFSHLIQADASNVIEINECLTSDCQISLDVTKCLGICIHQTDNDFSTVEDKVIRYRYHYLSSRVTEINSTISLYIKDQQFDYEYINILGLDFTFERKMSSKVVKDLSTGEYYLFSKGAIDMIASKLTDSSQLAKIESIISAAHPELRLLAFTIRKITLSDLDDLASLETNLELLGIIGIRDNLQPAVPETIAMLRKNNLESCMCTGDRKITALAIAQEANIIENTGNILEVAANNELLIPANLSNTTLIFNGATVDTIGTKDNPISWKQFGTLLQQSRNFIGYSLIPDHKRKLVSLLEKNNIRTLAIGDGFNDIGMFNVSSISVAMKGNSYVETNADFSIGQFMHLSHLLALSSKCYVANSNLIIFTFYRAIAVIFSILTYCLLNYDKPTMSLYNGFVIQAFNFAWCIFGLFYFTFFPLEQRNARPPQGTSGIRQGISCSPLLSAQQLSLTSYSNLTRWNIRGILTGVLTTLICYYYFSSSAVFSDITCFILITILNFKLYLLNTTSIDFLGVLTTCLSVSTFILYMLYIGSFSLVFTELSNVSYAFWLIYTIVYI